jgi:hypothetical protein
MKLRYETGVATMIQFIVIGMLNLLSMFYLSVDGCVEGDDCVTNAFLNIVVFVMIGIGLMFIATLGYAAQHKRSKRLSQLLIAVEGFVALVSLFSFQHYQNNFSRIISAISLGLALWVSILAFRLMRSGGGRISRRTRRRPSTKS